MDQRLLLISDFIGNRISRREFMQRAAVLGVAGAGVTTISGTGPASAQDAPVQGGRIIIATKESPNSMDNHVDSAPASGIIYDNIYDQLVVIDPAGNILPGLASSWELIEPTRWRLTLREGVIWHNGDAFTANDLKLHFDRVFNPDDPGRPAGLLASYDSNEVVDDYTFDIITQVPYPLLINDLSPRWQSISTNPTQLEAVGAAGLGEAPIGTGPFKFKSWDIGGSLILEANDDYWDGRPFIDEVEFRAIPEDSSRLLALESGEVDFIYVVPRFEVPRLQDDSNFQVYEEVTFVTAYITTNCSVPPLDDLNVRQAIGYAVNKEDIIAIAFEGQASVAEQLIAPPVLGYNAELDGAWPYDPDQARALLDESGWVNSGNGIREKDGQSLSIDFHFAVGSRFPEGVAEIIQSNMRDVGIELVLMQREASVISAEQPERLLPLHGGATGLGTGNFGQLNYEHYHSEGGRSYNFLRDSNPEAQAELDVLVDAANVEFDEETRMDLWGQVQEFNRNYALKIPLFHPRELGAAVPMVRDAYLHPGEYLRMKRVWIAPE